jgi:hypothetical protein
MTRTMIVVAVAIISVAGFFIVRAALHFQAAAAHTNKIDASFVANSTNDTALSVKGWNRIELDRILADFSEMYRDETSSPLVVTKKAQNVFTVTFPQDIQPTYLLFLVNYIQYPKAFDLKQRSIGVVAHASLTSAFGVPDNSLVGKRAMIYVPTNDTSYDLVYARVQPGGAVYEISFTDLAWRPMPDTRTPAAIAGL